MFHPDAAYQLAKERQQELEEAARDGRRARTWAISWRRKTGRLAAVRPSKASA